MTLLVRITTDPIKTIETHQKPPAVAMSTDSIRGRLVPHAHQRQWILMTDILTTVALGAIFFAMSSATISGPARGPPKFRESEPQQQQQRS
jgi:hypothetical protein